jgi:hypothetical protein
MYPDNEARIAELTKEIALQVLAELPQVEAGFFSRTTDRSGTAAMQPAAQDSSLGVYSSKPADWDSEEQTGKIPSQNSIAVVSRRLINRVGSRKEANHDQQAATIAGRLVLARLKCGFTQKAVAEAISTENKTGAKRGIPYRLSRTSYCMYELGASEPSLATIQKLAVVFAVTPGWLAFGFPNAH